MARIYLLNSKTKKTVDCCICEDGLAFSDAIVERRPTGESFMIEEWVYCRDCWDQMQQLRRSSPDLDNLLAIYVREASLLTHL